MSKAQGYKAARNTATIYYSWNIYATGHYEKQEALSRSLLWENLRFHVKKSICKGIYWKVLIWFSDQMIVRDCGKPEKGCFMLSIAGQGTISKLFTFIMYKN